MVCKVVSLKFEGPTLLIEIAVKQNISMHLDMCGMGVWYQDKDMISRERCSMKFCTGWVDKCALPGNRLCFALELNSCYAVTSLSSSSCLSTLSLLKSTNTKRAHSHTQTSQISQCWYSPLAAVFQWYIYTVRNPVSMTERYRRWTRAQGGRQEWRTLLLRKWE